MITPKAWRNICYGLLMMILTAMWVRMPVMAADRYKQVDEDPSQRTIVFEPNYIDCSDIEAKAIQLQLITRFKSLQNIQIIPAETVGAILQANNKPLSCHDPTCAIELGKLIGAHRVIIGSVRKFSRYTEEQLADTGSKQYIKKTRKDDFYLIRLTLIDPVTGATLASREEEIRSTDVQAAITKMVASFKEFLPPRIIPRKEPVVPEKITLKTSIALIGSGIVPHSRFRSIITGAGGIYGIVGLHNIMVKNTALFISGGYYFASSTSGDVASFKSGVIAIHGGYMVPLYKGFFVLPTLGFGYHFHAIKDAYEPRKNYYDPLVTFRVEAGYTIYKGLQIVLIPGYTLFFEPGYVGNYVNIDGGIRYLW